MNRIIKGVRRQETGGRFQVSGVRCQEVEVLNPET
jgi:hypothetical protein